MRASETAGMSRRTPLLLAATAAVCLLAAPAAQAATTVATETREFPVSAYRDAVAWSSYDEASGAYRLMLRRAGAVQALPVPAQSEPFDVDLGTDGDGRLVAVYSRSGRLYEWSSASGAERALGIRGTEPTVRGGRLAFVRRVGGRDVLYLRRSADAPSVRQFTGDTSRFSHIGLPDLSRTHLAYVTYGPGRYGFGGQNLRLQTLTGPSRVVYRATSGGANAADIVSPSFDAAGTHLYWARTNNGSGTGNRYLRLDARHRPPGRRPRLLPDLLDELGERRRRLRHGHRPPGRVVRGARARHPGRAPADGARRLGLGSRA